MSDSPEDVKPVQSSGEQGAELGRQLEAIQGQDDQPNPEQNDSQEWQRDPQRFVGELLNRALRPGVQLAPVDNPIVVNQHTVLSALRDHDLGDYASLPEAISDKGGRLFSRSIADELRLSPDTIVLMNILGVMATMPDGFDGSRIPAHKGESREEEALRVALTNLRSYSEAKLRKESEFSHDLVQALKGAAIASEQAKSQGQQAWEAAKAKESEVAAEVERYNARLAEAATAMILAREFMSNAHNAQFTAEQTREVLDELAQNFTEHEAHLADWTILPPEPTVYGPRESGVEDAPLEPHERIRRERVDELHELVSGWGEGVVVQSRFRTDNADIYLAAILPQTLPDGRRVEHAVVDNPAEGNARFIWRQPTGDLEAPTWQDVFVDKFKSQAKAAGARKIVHRGDWQSRTLEYLTAPEGEIYPDEP